MQQALKSPFYFPIERRLYEVAPGLKPLGYDFGNSDYDQKIFQITPHFGEFRKNKVACRKERLSKYFATANLTSQQTHILAQFIIENLVKEYPSLFMFNSQNMIFTSQLTGDRLTLNSSYQLVEFKNLKNENTDPKPAHILDALALQFEEDYALCSRRSDMTDDLSMIHLCSGSHWACEDKIGKSFLQVHSPIPHFDKIGRVSTNMIEAMINKGPFVRFVWSFVTDTRLNHHPIAPTGIDQNMWKGRSFNSQLTIPFYLRVERQVVYGLPEIDSSFFGIGISFIDGNKIKSDTNMRENLIGALNSMSPESRIYKGVDSCFTELMNWLNNS